MNKPDYYLELNGLIEELQLLVEGIDDEGISDEVFRFTARLVLRQGQLHNRVYTLKRFDQEKYLKTLQHVNKIVDRLITWNRKAE